ncbi:MAG: PQQ-dependent sugar dehydrogenase [Planctomycetota bacterium]|nr:PQQ-dependent sugar dehydrogenase [Planctomycetota bacterium]
MRRHKFLLPSFLAAVLGALAARAESPAANSLEQLKATWKSVPSRVVGSPDPPLPYRVRRVLPEMKLSNPICVAKEPDGTRLYFIDQDPNYRLCRTKADQSGAAFDALLDFGEGLAYSIAFHPDFSNNGFLLIGSSDPVSEDGKTKHCRVTRYTVSRDAEQAIDAATALVILQWESNGHNGAAIAFGLDGMLYITSGDGTSDSDTNLKGQGLDHLLAKVLRIDVDQPSDGQPYSIPPDNPFVNVAGARPETWAYGFRNPWRMSVDPRTGHVWVGNNGQDLWEQIYLVERGANYGWSVYEGGQIFYANRQLGPTAVSKPTFDHPHSEARSMTGGVVYYGSQQPGLQGAYIYGDYSTGKIWGAKVEGRDVVWHKELADSTLAIAAFGSDADGELLIADYRGDHQGGFYSLELNDSADQSDAFPKLLSQTGLFASVRGHQVASGLIPYSVNAPLWSDGASKERYIYLPPTTVQPTTGPAENEKPATITMTDNRGWNFPDLTVLVKSFAFEAADDSSSRRWIETRLLTKQQGEWVGYSYAWNDEQTEATLVAANGLDRELIVRSSGAEPPTQAWRFPSRAECMVCHSRAANYVLGLSTLQMNKGHDFGGTKANQLEVLTYLDILPVAWTADARKQLGELFKASGLDDAQVKARSQELTGAKGLAETLPSELPVHWSAAFPRLVDPDDKQQDLDARARSYLHANCAQCHVEAGGGNAQFNLEFTKPLADAKLVDEEPLHHKFDLPDARLVAAGDPDRSVLLHRLAMRGAGQMPQLATTKVDERAVELLREWISQLK